MSEQQGFRIRRAETVIVLLLTLAAVATVEWLSPVGGVTDRRMAAAAQLMHDATLALAAYREANGPAFDPEDINRTGLIGTSFSPLTTTLGTLEAKRTTTNPNLAAVAVKLLLEADVREGDAIAVGASGSFPAVVLAVLCASDALDLDVGLIVSLGSSQWGANLMAFTWLDMQDILGEAGLLRDGYRADAASLGGSDDVGTDLDPSVREALRERVESSGARLIAQSDLAANVTERLQIYEAAFGGRPIRAFVNIGGASANVGTDAAMLELSPGVNWVETIPPVEARGVLFEYASQGIPIVHFLYIAGLAAAYQLPWDPSPLPTPDETSGLDRPSTPLTTAIATTYVALVAAWLTSVWIRRRRAGSRSI